MLKQRRHFLIRAAQTFDLLTMMICFFISAAAVSYSIRNITFVEFLSMRIKVQNFLLFFVFLLLWHFIFSRFHLYRSRRLSPIGGEIMDVVKGITVSSITIFILSILFDITLVTRTFLIVFWTSSCTISILSRVILRYALKQFRIRGRNLRHMVFVGTNPRAIRFAREIETMPELGYNIIGFVDDDWSYNNEFKLTKYNLIARLSNFPAFLRDNVVDEVAICLPMKSFYQENARIVSICEEQGIIVRFLTDLFNLKRDRFLLDKLEEEKIISVYYGKINGWQYSLKRVMDVLLSLILIVILSPVFMVVALLIKITSPGPVFFVQERLGVNKRRFRLYKFRTMIPDAEKKQAELEYLNEMDGAAFKIRNDPRITPIGRFFRKMSIDELPQLFNVLKGDMSLVGPRPHSVRDYEEFDQDWHRRRFSIRPGITCLWQVTGRNDVSFSKWMELDMEYIDNWSLGLDLKILVKTIPAVLRGSGAV